MVGRLLVEGTVAVEEVGTNAATSWPLPLLRFGEGANKVDFPAKISKSDSWR